MLASVAEFGPATPLPEKFEIEVEGGSLEDIFVESLEGTDIYRVVRIHGSSPISVYANYND